MNCSIMKDGIKKTIIINSKWGKKKLGNSKKGIELNFFYKYKSNNMKYIGNYAFNQSGISANLIILNYINLIYY